MNRVPLRWRRGAVYSICVGYFLGFGILLIPLLGLETDEVIFLKNLYVPKGGAAWFSFFHHYYPSMMMSYLGALKSWLYAPVLLMGPLSIWMIRLPMLIAAALTIIVLGRVLQLISGAFASCVAMLLFATDSSLLTTAINDWGPVVLQDLLMAAALLVLLIWNQRRRDSLLFWAGLLLGLNLWNKALFLWFLAGMLVAFALVGLRFFLSAWSARRGAVLLLGLLVGAYPLVRYNLKNHAPTVGQNAHFDSGAFGVKLHLMTLTLNGQAAPGALVNMERAAPDRVRRPLDSLSRSLASYTPDISTYLVYGGLAVLSAGLALGRSEERRWIGFFALADSIAWLQAALTGGAGTGLHHTALFLILWYCAIAVACGAVAGSLSVRAKPLLALGLALVCVRAAGAENLVYANMLNYEARSGWSNAEGAFTADLLRLGVEHALPVDWGFSDVITTRSRNRIVVSSQTGELQGGQFDKQVYLACQAPSCVIVRHTPNTVIDTLSDHAFEAAIEREKLMPVDIRAYESTHGVPVILTFHLRHK